MNIHNSGKVELTMGDIERMQNRIAELEQKNAVLLAQAVRKFVADTIETGELGRSDCQWLENWRDEWLEEQTEGGE
jgi:hypothetical protein